MVSPPMHGLLWFQNKPWEYNTTSESKNLGNTMQKSVPIKIDSEKPWRNNGFEISPFMYHGKSAGIEDLQKSLRFLQFPHGIFSEEDLSGWPFIIAVIIAS